MNTNPEAVYKERLKDTLERPNLVKVLALTARGSEAEKLPTKRLVLAFRFMIGVYVFLLLGDLCLAAYISASYHWEFPVIIMSFSAALFAGMLEAPLVLYLYVPFHWHFRHKCRAARQSVEDGVTFVTSEYVHFEKQWFGLRAMLCERFDAFCDSSAVDRREAEEYLRQILSDISSEDETYRKWVAWRIADRNFGVPDTIPTSKVDTAMQTNESTQQRGPSGDKVSPVFIDRSFGSIFKQRSVEIFVDWFWKSGWRWLIGLSLLLVILVVAIIAWVCFSRF